MTQQQDHMATYGAIDSHLRTDSFDSIALTAEHKYQGWYATLLSSLAILVAGEEVEYAYANFEPSMPDVSICVFTTNLVVVAEIDINFDGVPMATALSRHSLVSMKLSASDRIDARDGRSYEWPGSLYLLLNYPGLPKPIEVVGDGANRYKSQEPSSFLSLIRGLSADLAMRRREG